MRREQITSISGVNIYTDYGRRVAIGNADHVVGDWVWVDGIYVFGTQQVSRALYIPQLTQYYYDFMQTDDYTIRKYRENKIKNGNIVFGTWQDIPHATELDLANCQFVSFFIGKNVTYAILTKNNQVIFNKIIGGVIETHVICEVPSRGEDYVEFDVVSVQGYIDNNGDLNYCLVVLSNQFYNYINHYNQYAELGIYVYNVIALYKNNQLVTDYLPRISVSFGGGDLVLGCNSYSYELFYNNVLTGTFTDFNLPVTIAEFYNRGVNLQETVVLTRGVYNIPNNQYTVSSSSDRSSDWFIDKGYKVTPAGDLLNPIGESILTLQTAIQDYMSYATVAIVTSKYIYFINKNDTYEKVDIANKTSTVVVSNSDTYRFINTNYTPVFKNKIS